MTPDDLEGTLHAVAGHAGRTGRLADAADIRRRGDARRRRRQATAALGVALVGVLAAGVVVTRPDTGPRAGAPAAASAAPGSSPAAPAPSSDASAPPLAPTSSPRASAPFTSIPAAVDTTPGTGASAAPTDPTLSGKRQVTIVRVQTDEGGLALLDGGRVAEVDDDSGRQLFVLTPIKANAYLIRTAEHGSDGQPSCWRSTSNGSDPLTVTVTGAACSAADPRQQFVVTPRERSAGWQTYAIANQDAYLQLSGTRGLILEELGDATLTTTFRFVDDGAAPATAG